MDRRKPINEARPLKPARDKMMDFLARRDHSELELRQKLSDRGYQTKEIDHAIAYARESKWILDDDELATKVAAHLSRKKKGHRYINQYLQSKGLPRVEKDREGEMEKALEVIELKMRSLGPFTFEEQSKIARLLKNRGFDDETIRLATKTGARKK